TAETLRLVGDVGVSTNGDRNSHSHPAYLLGGLIYSPTPDLDFDLGVQFGANRVAEDRIFKAGVTIRW
ncbi:MAG: transporter, partial [Rhodocyclales bacterium]|nr:transporter [Rhodocyclales bacterium]